MIIKGTKQLGSFKKGINLYIPKRRIVSAVPGSLLFNDPNQFLQFPRSEVISILAAEPFTIEAWIKPTSIKTIAAVDANGNPDPLDYGDIIIGDTQDSGNNWSLQLFNNKLTFYRYKNEVTGFKFFTSNTQIPLDAWTHVAVSYDGDSTLLIFINGVLDATFADYSPPDTEFSVITIGNLWLSGTSASGGGAFAYKGYITNLRINDNQIFYHMVSPFEPTAPLGYISGTTLLLLANTNDPTKDSGPGDVSITNVGSVASSSQYPTVTDCANNDAKVLMVGWYAGARPLTRDNENLYTYYTGGSSGDETVYRANSSSPWIYTNVGIPLATSLTVSQFPWQAVWPTSPDTYTATKVCPNLGIPYASTVSISSDFLGFTITKENTNGDGNLLYQFDESYDTPPRPANYYGYSAWDYDTGTGNRAILFFNTSATTYYSNQPDVAPNVTLSPNTWYIIKFSFGNNYEGSIPPIPDEVCVNTSSGQSANYIPIIGWSPSITITAA